jgi:cellulose synthase/poly-beta-1,6-N-acetylglucosamine synthase-like glycosyltransferase
LERIDAPPFKSVPVEGVRGLYVNAKKYPGLTVVDKENGGRSSALNAALNFTRYPYVMATDADTLFDKDALVRIAYSFMDDDETIAVGGTIRVQNDNPVIGGQVISQRAPRKAIAIYQYIEYARAFLVGRTGLSAMNALLIISGAFGAFRKDLVLKVGGYTQDTIGEDMNLTLKLHQYMRDEKLPYKIRYIPDPICWTQVPESARDLRGQRRRWEVGLVDCLARSRGMLFNPKYGTVGMFALPYYWLFELLGPVVEAIGIIVVPLAFFLGMLNTWAFILFFVATMLFGVIFSTGSLVIQELSISRRISLKSFLKLFLFAIIENLGYRQMLVFVRLTGLLRYKKYKHSWGKIKRVRME